MINLKLHGIDKLKAALGAAQEKLPREVATALNATAKVVKREMARDVTQELAVSQSVVMKTLSQRKKASKTSLSALVVLAKTRRISLRQFGARQTKKGVSYKISKTDGRKFIPGAFQGPKPGVMKASWRGTVFKRAGKERLPIIKLQGVSPWGVLAGKYTTARGKIVPYRLLDLADRELRKQVERRVRYNVLKSQGVI